MKRRDDFSAKVIKVLKDRVGHRCSNPDCRVPTSGPNKNPHLSTSIGQAAHITAAAKGGPRYDASMTTEERASINNAIWLCNICARKIDVDPGRYGILTLQSWKSQAENLSVSELGQPLPRAEDGQNLITTVLKGLPGSFKRTAIANVHKATQHVLNSVDPRFRIDTIYENGVTKYIFNPLEEVSFTVNVPTTHGKKWISAFNEMEKHGVDVRLEGIPLFLTGSPVFDELGLAGGAAPVSVEVASLRKEAVLKFSMRDPSTNQVASFDDLNGLVSYGTESFSFKGRSLGGLFGMEVSRLEFRKLGSKVDVSVGFCLDPWQGKDIRRLPYLKKLLTVFEKLRDGWIIDVSLEFEGEPVIKGRGGFDLNREYLSISFNILEHIARLSEICQILGLGIIFKTGCTLSSEEYMKVIEILNLLRGDGSYGGADIKSNPTMVLIASKDLENLRLLLKDPDAVHSIRVETSGDVMEIFSHEVELPILETSLFGVKARIAGDTSSIKEGDEFLVEWIPTKSFLFSQKYLIDRPKSLRCP